jgi:hypothetical protein
MQKISSQDAASLLKQAGGAIRDLTTENQSLREKIARNERDARVVKLARDMEEKGLADDLSLAEKVAHLRKAPNLEVTEQAVKLAAPQGNMFGDIGEVPSGGGHPFEVFIATGEDTR